MIQGAVNGFLEVVVSLRIRGPEGQEREIEAIIDTGYSGNLTLPQDLVAELGLPFLIRSWSVLADGTAVAFNVHGATVVWNGGERHIEIDAVGVAPLLGMSLLDAHSLYVEVAPAGPVVIQPLA